MDREAPLSPAERLYTDLNEARAKVERLQERLMAYSETAHQRDTLLQENVVLKLEVEKLKTQAGWDRLRNG